MENRQRPPEKFIEKELWNRCLYRKIERRERLDTPGRSKQFITIELCRHPQQPQGVYGGGCKKAECPFPDIWEYLTEKEDSQF